MKLFVECKKALGFFIHVTSKYHGGGGVPASKVVKWGDGSHQHQACEDLLRKMCVGMCVVECISGVKKIGC